MIMITLLLNGQVFVNLSSHPMARLSHRSGWDVLRGIPTHSHSPPRKPPSPSHFFRKAWWIPVSLLVHGQWIDNDG